MIQRDYILRLIEQLAAALRSFLIVRDTQRSADRGTTLKIATAELNSALEEASQQGLGLSFTLIRNMPPGDLVELFRAGGDTWIGRCFLGARLFEIQAEVLAELGDWSQAEAVAYHSLYLYEQLKNDSRVPADYDVSKRATNLINLLQTCARQRSGPKV